MELLAFQEDCAHVLVDEVATAAFGERCIDREAVVPPFAASVPGHGDVYTAGAFPIGQVGRTISV